MSSKGLVYGPLFAKKAKIRYDTLRHSWKHIPRANGAISMYQTSVLDAWIADSARGFTSPPTVASLLDGTTKLLTLPEVLELLPHFSRDSITRRAQFGKIASLHLTTGYTVFDTASVMQLANPQPFYTTQEVCHILGIRNWATINDSYVKTGILATTEHPNRAKWPVVLKTELCSFLADSGLLPKYVSPEEWIDNREIDPDWLLSINQAAAYACVSPNEIREMLNAGELSYIQNPKMTERLIPTPDMLGFVESFPYLSPIEIAEFYGVVYQTIFVWRKAGLLNCKAHRHADVNASLSLPCFLALVKAMNPGIKPLLIFKKRKGSTAQTLSVQKAASVLGIKSSDLIELILSGSIPCITLPTGQRRLYQSAVFRAQRKLAR